MICIKTDIPEELCRIDDELKAIYHSQDTVCIWVFKTRQDRNSFMDDTVGMKKADRENYYLTNYSVWLSVFEHLQAYRISTAAKILAIHQHSEFTRGFW